jgi:hypothetical protein
MLKNSCQDTSSSKEGNKMKFLDNLFDIQGESNSNDTTYDRTYIRLNDSADYSKLYSKQTEEEHISYKEENKNFGLRTWIGLFLSFFLLCYVFSFNLAIVLPLLFLVLFIYAVISRGNKYYNYYLKRIRYFVRSNIRRIKKNEDTEEYKSEYKLMEI